MDKKILIIGCGDTGKRVAQQLLLDKNTIYATSHQAKSQALLQKLNINVVPANLDKVDSLAELPTENANIFYFAPPPITGTIDTRMQNFIDSLEARKAPKRIVYISTTGVYGDYRGEWVSENTTLNPTNDRSKRRTHAESLIQAFCAISHCEFIILRVAGIYCLEKLPLTRLTSGMKVLHPAIALPSNRIHANDLANCCIQAMYSSPANEIFNVADGSPSSISDYFIQTAKAFNLPTPEYLDWEQAEKELSPAMLSYLKESKKINITKLLKTLNVQLNYRTLIDGLTQCRMEKKNHS